MSADKSDSSATQSTSLLRRALRALLLICVVGLISMAGLTSYILSNPERVKVTLENILTTVTKRPFRVQGEFDVSFGTEIDVRATQVIWENPSWSDTANMMEIGEIEFTISLARLLDGSFIITHSRAENARLEFEWNNEDEFNWDFFPDEPDDDGPEEAIPVLLDKTELKDVRLVFKDSLLAEPLIWDIVHATQKQDAQNRLVMTANTQVGSRPVILQGRVGPFPELIVAGNVNAAFQLQGGLQSVRFTATSKRLLNLDELNFDLSWFAPDIAIVLDILNLPKETTKGSIDLRAYLKTKDETLRGEIEGDVGEFNIDGNVTAPKLNILTDLHAQLNSRGPSARGVGRLLGIRDLPKKPYLFNFKADSVPEGLKISQLYFATADAELEASGILPRPPSLINGDIQLDIKGNNLAEFQGLTDEVRLFEAPFSADIDLVSHGEGVPDSLTGKLTLAGMTGDINATLAENQSYSGSKFTYSLLFPNSQRLLSMFDLIVTTTKPMQVNGRGEILTKGIRADNLKMQIEDNSLTLNGLITYAATKAPTRFTTQTEGPSFNSLMRYYLPFDLGPSLPFESTGELKIENGILTTVTQGKAGTTNLDLKLFVDMRPDADTDMRLNINATGPNFDEWLQDFIREERINDKFNVSMDMRLSDDEFAINDIDLSIRNARLQGSIIEKMNADTDQYLFNLKARGKSLADELPKLSVYEPADVSFNLSSKGVIEPTSIDIEYLNGTIGSAKLDVSGKVSLPPALDAERLTINFKGGSLAELGYFEGWEVRDAPFNLQAIVNTENDRIEARNMLLVIGDSDLRGDLIADFSEKPNFDARFISRNISAGSVLNKEQRELLDSMIDGEDETNTEERFIPYTELPVKALNDFNAQVKISIDTLRRKEDFLSNVLLDSSLTDGALTVNKLKADTTLGSINSTLSYQPKNKSYAMEFSVTARNVRLPGSKEQEVDPDKFVGYNIDSWLYGTGTNSKDITATLDGFAWLRGGKREINNIKYSSLFGDAFTEVGVLINPFYNKDPTTKIACEAFLFEIEDGIMESSPIAFVKTKKLNMAGIGTIDLNTEKIKLGIQTSPRKGIGLSASDLLTPFVRLGGTLSNPKPEVDPKGTLIEGGAAVYTAGLSILAKSLYQRWIKADKTCDDYTAIARTARQQRDPKHVPAD